MITDEDLHKMPYLDMCMKESMRLYPAVIVLGREAIHDVEVQGIKLPKKSTVNIPVYHMHHFAEFFPEPERFIPERYNQLI